MLAGERDLRAWMDSVSGIISIRAVRLDVTSTSNGRSHNGSLASCVPKANRVKRWSPSKMAVNYQQVSQRDGGRAGDSGHHGQGSCFLFAGALKLQFTTPGSTESISVESVVHQLAIRLLQQAGNCPSCSLSSIGMPEEQQMATLENRLDCCMCLRCGVLHWMS